MFTMCLFMALFLGNTKQTEAASGYVLKVNRQTNIVTAYKDNVPVRVMLCSTGKNNATPTGTYYTQAKMRWHELDGPVWGQYCTRITGHYLFHSVYYYSPNDKTKLATTQYRKLGTQASHGCVRVSVEDAKWIYDNCSVGTKVVIYDSSDVGRLGKPTNVKVRSDVSARWDPTDPDTSNPYYINRPTIKISSKKATTITVGTEYKLKSQIKVYDYKGKNITSKLRVNGRVDTTTPGTYYLKYWAQDSKCNYAYKYFTVKVVKAKKPVFMGLDDETTLKLENKMVSLKYRKGVTAYDKDGTNLTSKIKVTYANKYNSVIKKVTKNGTRYLRFYAPGTYKIKYTVTGTKANGAKKTTKTLTVTVKDYTKPVLTDTVVNETITVGDVYGEDRILSGVSAKTTFTVVKASRITYTIKKDGQKVTSIDTTAPGTYVITYNVTNGVGKKAKAITRTVTVVEKTVTEDTTTEDTTTEDTTTSTTEDTTTATSEETTTAVQEVTTEAGTTETTATETTTAAETATTATE